jgi:flagellar motor switch protein FliM
VIGKMMERARSGIGAAVTAQTALAQMVTRHLAVAAEQAAAFDTALHSAFARMGNDWPSLGLQVVQVKQRAISVAEVADLIEPNMFVAMLDSATDDLGVALICPALASALVEGATTGRVIAAPATPRQPTRTDAALLAPMIDVLLRYIGARCAAHPMGSGIQGFVYGSFLHDPRPLALLLEDGRYRVITFDVTLGHGSVSGTWALILPAPPEHPPLSSLGKATAETRAWAQHLQSAIAASPTQLDVVLFRAQLALSTALSLAPGDMLCIPVSALETLSLRTLDGVEVGTGRLGQARGQRAVRLTTDLGRIDPADTPAIPRAASMTPVIRGVDAFVSDADPP